jgi:hypothetical protein
VQGELEVVVAAWPPPDPVDQDHVGVVPDGQVGGVPGAVGEPAQMRRRDLAQLQRAEHGEPQVQDARAEAVLARTAREAANRAEVGNHGPFNRIFTERTVTDLQLCIDKVAAA